MDKKNNTIVHTLGFNLTSEIEHTLRLLYEQNDKKDFQHVLVDLGFPLLEGKTLPDNIEEVKEINKLTNNRVAGHFGSDFITLKNVGVSQNWNSVKSLFNIGETDVLICADPDERPKNKGWIKAVSDVLLSGNKIAWCSLMMKEHEELLIKNKYTPINIAGHRAYELRAGYNWAQGGFSGKFLKDIGEIPVPDGAPIYGWIESACQEKIRLLNYRIAILADYYVEHTDDVYLYRQWKTQITSFVKDGQMSFEKWLIQQKKNNEQKVTA